MGARADWFLGDSILSVCLILFLICFPAVGLCQTTHAAPGLSEDHVNHVLQDSRGFMWFGRHQGLKCYDGSQVKTYRHNPNDPASISNNEISALYEDSQGVLWVGTNGGGLNRFDRAGDKFISFRHNYEDDNSISHDNVTGIVGQLVANSPVLWIGTRGGGLSRFDTQTSQFTHFRQDPSVDNSLGSNYISSLSLIENDTILIKSMNAGSSTMSLSRPGRFTRLDQRSDGVSSEETGSKQQATSPSLLNYWVYIFYGASLTALIALLVSTVRSKRQARLSVQVNHQKNPEFELDTTQDEPTSIHVGAGQGSTDSVLEDGDELAPSIFEATLSDGGSDDIDPKVIEANIEFLIMVVDDDAINRRVLVNHLVQQNYRTKEASNGADALALLEQGGSYDLILLDVMMPGLSGFEVCRKIREKHTTHELPILFLSAKTQGPDMVNGFDLGGNDYIAKPINRNVLLSRVRTHLDLLGTNRNLEIKVTERTRDLLHVHEELVNSARSAGMSEIAAEVLHNVGNTLNSIKTSVSMIQELAHDQKSISIFKKTINLLGKSSEDLFDFLRTDGQQEKLTSVMKLSVDGMEHQWELIQHECKSLQVQAHTISEILRQQQDYIEKEATPLQEVAFNDHLQELLKIKALAPRGLQIQMRNDCLEPYHVQLDKTKFKRILLYLLTNAQEAIAEKGLNDEGRIELHTQVVDARLRLDVCDNGIGIDKRLQERLFEQGFSTKQNYQGFGLHYCANAMAVMGGEISIFSEGMDKGARVSLFFPYS